MDDLDRASEREQIDRDYAISEALRAAPSMPPQGICYNCESIVPPGARFCDKDCRDDHDTRKNAERRRG